MPNIDHQQTECRSCEKLEHPELEILVSPCSKTHDAIIHCVEGYYRDLARNPRETGTCQRCTECSGFARYTGQPCSTYRDTVCCMDVNFDVAPNHHGVPLCRERPWFCRQGQYFDTTGFQCLPCPNNTFMPVDFHVRPDCFKCRDYITFEVNSPLHSVIVQPCNSTHDTVLSCPDGFYMKSTMGYRSDAMGCSPCKDCNAAVVQMYERRKCDGMQDTVCCPLPDMEVLDTPHGPECVTVKSILVVENIDYAPVPASFYNNIDGVDAEDDIDEAPQSDDDGYGQNGKAAKGSTHCAVLIVFSAFFSLHDTSFF